MMGVSYIRQRYLVVISAFFVIALGGLAYAGPMPLKCEDISELVIIGELEYVSFLPENTRQKARIDTGAKTSSLGVSSQESFERDGKRWIRFNVPDAMQAEIVEFERPLKRVAKIKRHGAEALERPVVEMKIRLGKIEIKGEFTLADRSGFEFPVLIGRNVLANKFVVDVNRKFSTSKIKEQ